ncbi:hypothetical protein [Sulfurimonas marina]|uniref:DUF4328 domain-containing protein n=1 Tax=Sulfurimonas marina TaxID=2590551 RepID=A0A7M1AXC1_9BACT|nr:hypothetical protein [Sulfurimonas marina]QOP42099.1 hypothetical protein FJR03_10255 [Sulfurimonas marina]
MEALLGAMAIFFVINLIITILFLLSQSSFAKAMTTSNPMNNTSGVWIWTQLIPFWSLVAIPVTLLKLNTQFQAFVAEKNLSFTEIKMYSNVWGWIWYGGTIASIFVPVLWVIALVGLIGFWVHISNVKKSILISGVSTSVNTSAAEPAPATVTATQE